MHGLYPKQYFWQCWFNEPDTIGIKLIADYKRIPKKEAAHLVAYWGIKHFLGEMMGDQVNDLNTPEGKIEQQERVRYQLEMNRLAKERVGRSIKSFNNIAFW